MPEPDFHGGHGLTLDEIAEQYGAIAGINAGGFKDEDGGGGGWPPQGITYSRGMNFEGEQFGPLAGLDGNDHFWSGWYSYEDCEAIGIRDAVCFGPCLVQDGEKVDPAAFFVSALDSYEQDVSATLRTENNFKSDVPGVFHASF